MNHSGLAAQAQQIFPHMEKKPTLLCNLEWDRMEESEKPKKTAKAHKAAGCGRGKPPKTETTGLKRMTQIRSHQARVYQFETY